MKDIRVIAVVVVVENGVAKLYDRSGECFTSVDLDRVSGLPDTSDLLWREWARDSREKYRGATYRIGTKADVWRRKANAMRLAWRDRMRRRQKSKGRGGQRAFRGDLTWDVAAYKMRCSLGNDLTAHRRRKADPWRRWAETVSRNGNRRTWVRYGTID